MTDTQIIRGNDIVKRLHHLQRQKEVWESAGHFTEIVVRSKGSNGIKNWPDVEILDLEIIRAITVAKIDLEIEKLQLEFLVL